MLSLQPQQVETRSPDSKTGMDEAKQTKRISLIDIARGIALVTMTIYHFTWDLEFYGWLLPATTLQTGWVLFARCIASSFLVLVGISLYLAHGNGIRWVSFLKRLMMVAGAAALISVTTWLTIPGGFVFFGILHGIALFSLLALPFLFLPWWLVLMAAAAVFFGDAALSHAVFDTPSLWWMGLSPVNPPSNDFVPLFPWFSAPLVGIAVAKLFSAFNLFERMKGIADNSLSDRSFGFIGRHSLIYYLVHQPAMMGMLWLFTAVAGPPDPTPAFLHNCTTSCSKNNDAPFCKAFCQCTADGLKTEKLFAPYHQGKVDLSTNPQAQSIINQCSAN